MSSNEKDAQIKSLTLELKRLGLKEYEIELLEKRIFDGYQVKDLIKDGWLSKNSVDYHYEATLRKLRKLWENR